MKIGRVFIKFRRIFALFAVVALGLLCCMTLSSCEEQDEEQSKYDVAIRVACSDGEIYEFPVGEDEKHVAIPYDGTERTYWVDSYNLPDHPRYGDEWLSPNGEGANVFGKTMTYCAPGGGQLKRWANIVFPYMQIPHLIYGTSGQYIYL